MKERQRKRAHLKEGEAPETSKSPVAAKPTIIESLPPIIVDKPKKVRELPLVVGEPRKLSSLPLVIGEPPAADETPLPEKPPIVIEGGTSASERKKRLRSQRRAARKRGLLREALEILVIIAIAIALTVLVRTFVLDTYEIPTGSMEPTIEVNDRIFAEKISYRFSAPSPGDIVTFYDPVIPNRVLIKRCIAVGGQTINLVDGKVLVDGVVLDEPYTHGKATKELLPMDGVQIKYPYRVPDGTVWVMGDNRINSADSRFFGPVPEEEFIGKALFRFLPLSRFGTIE